MTMIGASNFPQLCSRFIRMDPPPTVAIPHSSTAENLRAIKPRGIIRFIQADFDVRVKINKKINLAAITLERPS